jgi:hypothetical protein
MNYNYADDDDGDNNNNYEGETEEEEKNRIYYETSGGHGQRYVQDAILRRDMNRQPTLVNEEDDENNTSPRTPLQRTSRIPPHSAARSASRTSPAEENGPNTPLYRNLAPLIIDSSPRNISNKNATSTAHAASTLRDSPSIEATLRVTSSSDEKIPASPEFRGAQTAIFRKSKRLREDILGLEDKPNEQLFQMHSYAKFCHQFGSNENLRACIVAQTHDDLGFELCIVDASYPRALLKVEFTDIGKARLAREFRMLNYIDELGIDVETHQIALACEMRVSEERARAESHNYAMREDFNCVHFPLSGLFGDEEQSTTAYVVQCMYKHAVPLYRILQNETYLSAPMRNLAELYIVAKVLDSVETLLGNGIVNLNIDTRKVLVLIPPLYGELFSGLRVMIDVNTAGLGGAGKRANEFIGVDSFDLDFARLEIPIIPNNIEDPWEREVHWVSRDGIFNDALHTYDKYQFTGNILRPALERIRKEQEKVGVYRYDEMPFDKLFDLAREAEDTYCNFVYQHHYEERAHMFHSQANPFTKVIDYFKAVLKNNSTTTFIEKIALGALRKEFGDRC